MAQRLDSNTIPKGSPGLSFHRASGRACVFLRCVSDGKRRTVYFESAPDSDELQAEYAEAMRRWHDAGRTWAVFRDDDPDTGTARELTIVEMVDQFWAHSKRVGKSSSYLSEVRIACRPMLEQWGDLPVSRFTARHMVKLRGYWLAYSERRKVDDKPAPLNRNTINGRLKIIRGIFGWGVEEGIVSEITHHGLCQAKGVTASDPAVSRSTPKRPATPEQLEAVAEYLPEIVVDMITLQSLPTVAMRPGELIGMTMAEIDQSDPEAWIYSPADHKTAWKGKTREIALGPKAQAIVSKYLLRRGTVDAEAPVFPRWLILEQSKQQELANRERKRQEREEAERQQAKREGRELRLAPRYGPYGKRAAQQAVVDIHGDARRTDRPGAEFWDVTAFRRMLARACEQAGVPKFSAHQLRHAALTRLHRDLGANPEALEITRAVAGHSSAKTTERYVDHLHHESSLRRELARKFG